MIILTIYQGRFYIYLLRYTYARVPLATEGKGTWGGAVGLEGTKGGLWQSDSSYCEMKPIITLYYIMLYFNTYLTVVYKEP